MTVVIECPILGGRARRAQPAPRAAYQMSEKGNQMGIEVNFDLPGVAADQSPLVTEPIVMAHGDLLAT